jgi:hypothetical protein
MRSNLNVEQENWFINFIRINYQYVYCITPYV